MTGITSKTAERGALGALSYRLLIWVECAVSVPVGALGEQRFPRGLYCYTGSARRHPLARIQRHLARHKRRRWHIDYLLSAPVVQVVDLVLYRAPECLVNQRLDATEPVPGFGASDCRQGCGSHLRYLGSRPWDGLHRDLW